ncbi:MAG: FAD-dependent oxidoreductase [Alphaproteobacteria bacterium]|nr:FAD-dependent oxidoreductase [Alphaproteobacteria bacterium]MCB9691587.1 FAD-dependent oxidoreductase [Alphaproteobacteria bacterium]
MTHRSFDVLVAGAGFGGLSAALHLAEQGRSVCVCEKLAYAGGCASTFQRDGAWYEAGATMFAGFDEGGWMRHLVRRFRLDVDIVPLDPVAGFRSPGLRVEVPADRHTFVETMASLPGAPGPSVRAFFEEVRSTADVLWALFSRPERLPPFTLPALLHHVRSLPDLLPLVRGVGRPLTARLAAHGLAGFEPLRLWLDAVCQITVQTSADRAEAPVAMAAVDYFFRGTAHVGGGIGRLADAMVQAIRARGGEVVLANRVRALERVTDGWRVQTRRFDARARTVVAGLLPQDVDRLRGIEPSGRRVQAVREGWGAAMLYLRVDGAGGAHHLQCVLDPSLPLVEGNLVLVSVGAGDRPGPRTATVSTHIRLGEGLPDRVAQVQARMRANVGQNAPELRIGHVMTASPRTFERFTGREDGLVGGVPRVAGLRGYLDLWPVEHTRDLWLVGDSVFPGQSVLAVTVAGHRVAAAIDRRTT